MGHERNATTLSDQGAINGLLSNIKVNNYKSPQAAKNHQRTTGELEHNNSVLRFPPI